MKILTVIGARPQFIKAAIIGQELKTRGHQEILVHTGQHYDYLMSKVFFDELDIAEPDYNLEVGSASPANQMGAMMVKLEEILAAEKPDCVLVYGDTNSTLAAALVAVKSGLPIAHVEGGERNCSLDLRLVHPASIPEETNRVMTDHISSAIFCASRRAVDNLMNEGIHKNVFFSGDIMLDSYNKSIKVAARKSTILQSLDLTEQKYTLVTIHRAINTDNPERLKAILSALLKIDGRVIFPVHPRTRKIIDSFGLIEDINKSTNFALMDPVGYFDMLILEKHSRLIITDSGGVTREAFFSGVPAIIVDDTTAWIDLVLEGWCRLTGADPEAIITAANELKPPLEKTPLLGLGNTSDEIVKGMESLFGPRN